MARLRIPRLPLPPPYEFADFIGAHAEGGRSSLGQSFAEKAGRGFAAVLSRYPGPSLILNGERDRTSRKGETLFLAAQKDGHARVVPGAGHACSIDQPEIYNQAIREFAESIGWSSATDRLPTAGYRLRQGFGESRRSSP
jgi:pimeloyl-ACP methyl ester carboxylesterase